MTVSYRADVLRRFPSRCQVLAGGFLSATLATCDRSLPFRSTRFFASLHRPLRGIPRCAPWHREARTDTLPCLWSGAL